MSYRQWEAELLERERAWEQKKVAWRYIPYVKESVPATSFWWRFLGMVICAGSALLVLVAIVRLF